jgi:hypothetical protein
VSSHLWRADGLGMGQIIRFSVNGNTITQLGAVEVNWPFDLPGYESLGERVVITPSYVFASAPGRSNFIPWTDSYTNGGFTTFSWVLAFPRQGANDLLGHVRIGSFDPARVPPPEFDQPIPYYQDVHFGSDLAVSGSTLVVGSELFRVAAKPKIEEGRVYAYDIPPWSP